jgi:hypothetical protein
MIVDVEGGDGQSLHRQLFLPIGGRQLPNIYYPPQVNIGLFSVPAPSQHFGVRRGFFIGAFFV